MDISRIFESIIITNEKLDDEAEKSINETFRDLCGPIRAIWWDTLPVSRDVHITSSFITFAANLLLNLVILSTPQFRKQRCNAFMVALGFSDMFFVAFYSISQLLLGEQISHNYVSCTAWNYVSAYCFCLPWFIFLGMNVDRLYAIRRPLAYVNAARLNQYSVPKITLLCCLAAVIPPIPLLFDWVNKEGMEKNCECMIPIQNRVWVWWQSFTSIIIPVFAILLIWMKIGHTVGLATQTGNQVDSLLRWVTFKMIGITAFFLVCVTPFCLVFIGSGFFPMQSYELFLNTFAISLVNSLIQPFLYLGINGNLGKALVEKISCRKNDQNASSSDLDSKISTATILR